MMNVLLLYWGKKGGGAKYSLEISRELSKRTDVNLFLSISTHCELLDDFKQLHVPTLTIDTYRSAAGFMYQYVLGIHFIKKRLTQFIKENHIDMVIIGMDFFWGGSIHEACQKAGAQSVFVVHEPTPHPREPLFISMFKKRGLKKSIETVDHVVALTNHVKQIIVDQYRISESSITVIPHGIFSYLKAESPRKLQLNEPVSILYFGRIEYYKGLDILLDAFRILEDSRLDVELEIWGSGDLSDYQSRIDEIKNITIENDWVDEEKIPEIFHRADICVLPYRDASQSGIVGIASQAGVPIVATPAEGLMDQLEDTDVMFSKDFRPESLASAIEQVITTPELYTRISASEIEFAKLLDWSSIANQFIDISDALTKDR